MEKRLNRQDYACFAVLAALCILAYHGTLSHYFWEDDFFNIELAKRLSGNFRDLFGFTPYFRPVDRISFFLNYRLAGFSPVGFHAVNMALHLINALLLYILLRALTPGRLLAFSAAALFVTANTQSDAVLWVSGRSGLLCQMLLLLSVNSWVVYRRSGRNAAYYFSHVFFFLALFTKEEAVVYPLLIVLTDRLFLSEEGGGKKAWGRFAWFLAPLAVYAACRFMSQHLTSAGFINLGGETYGPGMNSPANLLEIFLYFFTPSFVKVQSLRPALALSAVIIAALLAAGYAAGQWKAVLWGVFWISVSFLPMSMFRWDLLSRVDTAFIRRYFYTPSVGAVFLMGLFINWLYNKLGGTRLAASIAASALLVMVVWNITEVSGREKRWAARTAQARAESAAVLELYPSLPPGKAGFFLGGFVQNAVSSRSMVRLIYGRDDVELYEDADALLGSGVPGLKAVLFRGGGAVTDAMSRRSVPLRFE